jgi:hypothetical protein
MAKRIVPNKVTASRNTVFTILPGGRREREVTLHFHGPFTGEVVKLDLKGLPGTWKDPKDGKKKPIIWLNRWAVRTKAGKDLKNVRYTVFVPPPPRKNMQFIYMDDQGLHVGRTPMYRGKRSPRAGKRQVEFNRGDPAAGYG